MGVPPIDPRAQQAGLALGGGQPGLGALGLTGLGGGQGGISHPLMPGLGLLQQAPQLAQKHPLLSMLGLGGGGDNTVSGLPQGTFGQPANPETGLPQAAAAGAAGGNPAKSMALMQLAQQFLGPALGGGGQGGGMIDRHRARLGNR